MVCPPSCPGSPKVEIYRNERLWLTAPLIRPSWRKILPVLTVVAQPVAIAASWYDVTGAIFSQLTWPAAHNSRNFLKLPDAGLQHQLTAVQLQAFLFGGIGCGNDSGPLVTASSAPDGVLAASGNMTTSLVRLRD